MNPNYNEFNCFVPAKRANKNLDQVMTKKAPWKRLRFFARK